MAGETPDLSELTRSLYAAAKRRDIDGVMAFHAADAVWDLSDVGLGTIAGSSAIRSFLEDWFRSFDYYEPEVREVVDLGGGVVFVDVNDTGRLAGTGGEVQLHRGWSVQWAGREVVRVGVYMDVEEAHARAERLAESGV